MDLRLNELAKMVQIGARVADIGTDHAYLPIKLVQDKISSFVIASDIAAGPLQNAAQDIAKAGLQQKIATRLGPGLTTIRPQDQIDTVIIAGMGGKMICRILAAAFKQNTYYPCLILEANIGEAQLRGFITQNYYHIVSEKIVATGGHTYELIKAEYRPSSCQKLTPPEEMFGPVILKKQQSDPVFQQKWHHQLSYFQHLLSQLNLAQKKDTAKIARLKEIIKMIREVLK